ncbi:pigment epithelium-derived factor [Prionailurus iriomotensis]
MGLSDFAFITQLQLGDGQDGLNSLQLSVYVMNEFRGK